MAGSRPDASHAACEWARFFATPADFRDWLVAHHQKERELWVGFHRKGTARPSITWPESVDEALCVGWIDGIRKTVDADSYKIRFTPRKAASIWSAVNIGRVEQLTRKVACSRRGWKPSRSAQKESRALMLTRIRRLLRSRRKMNGNSEPHRMRGSSFKRSRRGIESRRSGE